MISIIVLIVSLLLIFLITAVVLRSIIKKQQLIGRPPIPVVFFLLAKILVLVNLTFLMFKGLNINVCSIFVTAVYTDIIALVFLITGTVILFISTFKLNKDLVFMVKNTDNMQKELSDISHFNNTAMKVLIIFANPNPLSFKKAILDNFVRGLKEAGHQYDIVDLYKIKFNPVLQDKDYAFFVD